MNLRACNIAVLGCALAAAAGANAGTPCDFNGLSVGDMITPQKIMQHLGITKYTSADPVLTDAEKKAKFDAQMKRAEKVGLMNEAEEEEQEESPLSR